MIHKKMNQKIFAAIIAVVIVGGGAFYAGLKYDQSKNPAASRNSASRFQQFGAAGQGIQSGAARGTGTRGANGNFTAGEVIAKDDKSITIKMPDGGSKIILFSETTPIMKSINVTSQDITIGEQVTISGTANSDGSLTAQTIQLRPANPAASQSPAPASQ